VNPRFILVGGFLGAGKSTTVARLARRFQQAGRSVAIVTNDQTEGLVDTESFRSQGFDVGEVAGACFCCNFNDLTGVIESLDAAHRPDVVIAEPVGSCTDLIATVIKPLERTYERPLDIAPYGVILKPSHGIRILGRKGSAGFSPQAEYIFRKQIEECDFVAINRIDELSPVDVDALENAVATEFAGRPIVRMSAKTGAGFDLYCEMIDQSGEFARRAIDLDYDVYAVGEAELGWLNAQCSVKSDRSFSMDEFLMTLTIAIRDELTTIGAETAHVKSIAMCEGFYAVANLVSSFTDPQLSLPSHCHARQADVVVNARVATSPARLEEVVRRSAAGAAKTVDGELSFSAVRSLSPDRPVPTHRIVE
jgi:G3E family GTPase